MSVKVLNKQVYDNYKHLFEDLESGNNPCAFKEAELDTFSVVHRYCVVCGEDRFPGDQWRVTSTNMKGKGISAICCSEKRCKYVFFVENFLDMIKWDKVNEVRENFVKQYAPL